MGEKSLGWEMGQEELSRQYAGGGGSIKSGVVGVRGPEASLYVLVRCARGV